MASTYDYRTGAIEFDFHLKKEDTVCRRFVPRTIGGHYCRQCKDYKGSHDGYVACGFHTEDDEGASRVRWRLAEELKHEAMCAFY